MSWGNMSLEFVYMRCRDIKLLLGVIKYERQKESVPRYPTILGIRQRNLIEGQCQELDSKGEKQRKNKKGQQVMKEAVSYNNSFEWQRRSTQGSLHIDRNTLPCSAYIPSTWVVKHTPEVSYPLTYHVWGTGVQLNRSVVLDVHKQ